MSSNDQEGRTFCRYVKSRPISYWVTFPAAAAIAGLITVSVHSLLETDRETYLASWLFMIHFIVWVYSLRATVNAVTLLYSDEPERAFQSILSLFFSARVCLVLALVVSVFFFIGAFAALYFDISQTDPNSFNEKLTPLSSFYFSVITFATVGYGDIVPLKDYARIVVSLQVLLSVAYGVSIFSLVATFLRGPSR